MPMIVLNVIANAPVKRIANTVQSRGVIVFSV